MSRFGYDGDGDYDYYNNAGDLWWANIQRALGGRRGQRDLRELEAALLTLPEKRLISGRLASNGEVCAVGALAAHRRVTAGEAREAVLAHLESALPYYCECGCKKEDHAGDEGACSRCAGHSWKCEKFVLNDEGYEEGDYVTTQCGKSIGLTSALAWRLAYLNDEDFEHDTPEQRYEHVLAWVQRSIDGTSATTNSVRLPESTP